MRWAASGSFKHKLLAVELAERALADAPQSPRLHLLFASALTGVGRSDEARLALESAWLRFPGDPAVGAALGELLLDLGDGAAVSRLVDAAGEQPWAARLALRLAARGYAPSQRGFEQAVARFEPADPMLFDLQAHRLRSDPAALVRLCDDRLAIKGFDAGAVYLKVVALAMLGASDQAAALLGIERFVKAGPDPESSELLAALSAEIQANPTLHADPAGYAQRNGLRTRLFPAQGDEATPKLQARLRELVSAYAGELEGEHPFVQARPERALMTAWALIFRTAGHQVHHVHPGGWLTGVFYVAAPRGEAGPGGLLVGGLPDWAGVAAPWPTLLFPPEPGSCVLFPAYMPHETCPTGSEEVRISVAFDVTRADDA